MAALPVQAQVAFPSKPLKIVVPNAAGGAADITARTVAQKLAEALGQSVVVENKPSAGGIVAGEMVARAEPDGHTLLLISSGSAVSAALFKSLPFDTVKDFTPVSKLASFDLVIAVAESGRFKNLSEFLAYARANPGKLNIGTPQIGTTQNLAAELFVSSAGLTAQIVPFNGTPPALIEIIAGRADMIFSTMAAALPSVQSNRLHALATPSPQRIASYPDLPTMQELGYRDFVMLPWYSLSAPAGTPPALLAQLEEAAMRGFATPAAAAKLTENGLVPAARGRSDMLARIVEDRRRNQELMRVAGIQPE
jgi:tripartite-type tricarboxylate transporter receptor subunit TctC